VYSWPNVILPFFGGFISDKLGVRLMGVVFTLLITAGQAIVALGASMINTNPGAAWYTMYVP
jgi:MFS family permease